MEIGAKFCESRVGMRSQCPNNGFADLEMVRDWGMEHLPEEKNVTEIKITRQ